MKQIDTYYVVAMVILLAPVSICGNANKPVCNICKWTEGPSHNTHGSPIVLTLPIRTWGVDDPCLR